MPSPLLILMVFILRARRKEDEEEAERPLVPSPLWKLGFRPKGAIFIFISILSFLQGYYMRLKRPAGCALDRSWFEVKPLCINWFQNSFCDCRKCLQCIDI